MDNTRFALLMDSLGKQLDVKAEGPLESPVNLAFGEFEVTLATDQRSFAEELLIYAVVGVVPEDKELAVYRILLEANLLWNATGDATIGVNSFSREVTLAYRLPVEGLDGERLAAVVGCFYQVAKGWHAFLRATQEGASDEEAAAPRGVTVVRA